MSRTLSLGSASNVPRIKVRYTSYTLSGELRFHSHVGAVRDNSGHSNLEARPIMSSKRPTTSSRSQPAPSQSWLDVERTTVLVDSLLFHVTLFPSLAATLPHTSSKFGNTQARLHQLWTCRRRLPQIQNTLGTILSIATLQTFPTSRLPHSIAISSGASVCRRRINNNAFVPSRPAGSARCRPSQQAAMRPVAVVHLASGSCRRFLPSYYDLVVAEYPAHLRCFG